MTKVNVYALSMISLALAGCGSDESVNQPGTVSVSGLAKEGEVLTATATDPDGIDQSSLTYRWLVDGVQIPGATSSSFTLTAEQAGEQVYASVIYTDNRGLREAHTSAPTAEVEALPVNFAGSLSISGSPTVGQTLEAIVSDENGVAGEILYTWFANGETLEGQTTNTLALTDANLGQTITVSASYSDDQGFEESLTSEQTTPVQSDAVNTEAILSIDNAGILEVGSAVTATLIDPNGTSGATFVWMADDDIIEDQTASTFVLDASLTGKTLSVSTEYTDDNGYAESASATATGVVHSVVVNGLSDLAEAVLNLEDNAVVGLDQGNYDGSDTLNNAVTLSANNTRLVLIQGAEVTFSGNLCIHIAGNDNLVDGLTFTGINLLSDSECAGNGPSSIYITGNNNVFSNNTVTDESLSHGLDNFSWIGLKGLNNTITRNAFSDSTGQKVRTTGGVITIYNNSEVDDQEGHTISYNHFKDFGDGGSDDSRNSSAYMIQIGRSTGSSSQEPGLNTIEFNLFTDVNLDRRYMRVQSGDNIIRNNTFLDGSGMIALEDGNRNTVANNIFINTLGDNSDDGGVSYGPYGHTITNNYIAGLRTTSGDRAGLYANSDVLDNSGNSSATPAVVIVSNNTLLNSREAIEFASKECLDSANPVAFLVDFDNNLIANGETGASAGNEGNGAGREAIQDDCELDSASDFDGNHVYSAVLTNSGGSFFELFPNASNNLVGTEGAADLGMDAEGLLFGQNTDAGKGADTSQLVLLTEDDVGPGSQ